MERVRQVRLPAERRAIPRFALDLEVRYSVCVGRRGKVASGLGRTVDMSSTALSFTSDRPLLIGQKLDVSMDWPVLLDGSVQLELVMSGVVTRANGTGTVLQILRHEFKTRRVALSAVPPRESVG